mmetsp:Transcript_13720/g.21279  ORF Transcript_13720/g.21279 Transcript_13720/m.21279 type:complete len:257 (+) Transcript_13720:1895-2665(+)
MIQMETQGTTFVLVVFLVKSITILPVKLVLMSMLTIAPRDSTTIWNPIDFSLLVTVSVPKNKPKHLNFSLTILFLANNQPLATATAVQEGILSCPTFLTIMNVPFILLVLTFWSHQKILNFLTFKEMLLSAGPLMEISLSSLSLVTSLLQGVTLVIPPSTMLRDMVKLFIVVLTPLGLPGHTLTLQLPKPLTGKEVSLCSILQTRMEILFQVFTSTSLILECLRLDPKVVRLEGLFTMIWDKSSELNLAILSSGDG